MGYIPANLRRSVVDRASNRCEYCGLSQLGQIATFHIDHVIPVVAGGSTEADNLALACVSCSLHKGARQFLPDPQTGQPTPVFNPRQDRWSDHFRRAGITLQGKTATGRTTIAALQMNRPLALAIRDEEARIGRHPQSGHQS
jgi:hypothetical protein